MQSTMPLNPGVFLLLLFSAFANAIAQAPTEADGFHPLFNGRDLEGWSGDSRFWSVSDGTLVGQTTPDNTTEKNTFLVYNKDSVDDFELRFSYRVTGGNSGVQYRSQLIDKWVVKGLQADFEDQIHEGADRFSGMFFEENGRMFMGQRGEAVIVRANEDNPKQPKIELIGSLGDPKQLEQNIRRDDWNEYTIIAKGNVFIHIINGTVMSIGIDEDHLNFRKSGILAWQLHAGPPLKIELRDIRLRAL